MGKRVLGIDVGGSGIKAAIVDAKTGKLLSERKRLDTPQPSTPHNVAETVKTLVESFDYEGVIGVCFPTVVINNKATTHGNIDESWINVQLDDLFKAQTGHSYIIYNDADLAGMAEMELGAGKGESGMVIMITIGTGLGTGVFYNGSLVPNIELGRIFGKDGKPIEFYAGDKARKDHELSWKKWGKRFDFFLNHVNRVFSPRLYIIGGGASKKYEKFQSEITCPVPIKIAKFMNNAGIIGAAMAASKEGKSGLRIV